MLTSHLHLPEDRIQLVEDGETLALGGKTLTFVFTPWVHWPETFCTLIPEDKLLFSCDFFGSHLATTDLFVTDEAQVYEAAKRCYAEIMMPFRKTIVKNLEKLAAHEFDMIAPSHGPVYDKPGFILDAYRDWTSPQMKNEVVLPYASMHGSTEMMVKHLIDALARHADRTHRAASGRVLCLASGQPVAAETQVCGDYRLVRLEQQGDRADSGLIPNLKVEVVGTVLHKGLPDSDALAQLDALAEAITKAHAADENVQTD